MFESIYTVYSLCDGAIDADIYDGDDFNAAWNAFTSSIAVESAITERDYELTVHLYEPNAGILHAEECIVRTN